MASSIQSQLKSLCKGRLIGNQLLSYNWEYFYERYLNKCPFAIWVTAIHILILYIEISIFLREPVKNVLADFVR